MDQVFEKLRIGAGHVDDRTAHLQPVIDFLKAQGYTPATGDAFYFDRDGFGMYGFTQPLDTALLQAHFIFPDSIKLGNGSLSDTRHFVSIAQNFGSHGSGYSPAQQSL